MGRNTVGAMPALPKVGLKNVGPGLATEWAKHNIMSMVLDQATLPLHKTPHPYRGPSLHDFISRKNPAGKMGETGRPSRCSHFPKFPGQ